MTILHTEPSRFKRMAINLKLNVSSLHRIHIHTLELDEREQRQANKNLCTIIEIYEWRLAINILSYPGKGWWFKIRNKSINCWVPRETRKLRLKQKYYNFFRSAFRTSARKKCLKKSGSIRWRYLNGISGQISEFNCYSGFLSALKFQQQE